MDGGVPRSIDQSRLAAGRQKGILSGGLFIGLCNKAPMVPVFE